MTSAAGLDARPVPAPGGGVRVRLLGPVDIVRDGSVRPVTGARRKAVLAALALQPGHPVGIDALIDTVWGDRPPATAANTLQSHVSYLRGALGERSAIVARPPGYLLDVPPDAVDALRAEQLVARAAAEREPARRAALLRTALDMWHGTALSDVAARPRLHEQVVRLDRLRQDAEQALVDARLALGDHVSTVPDLERLVAMHPFREQLHHQLMVALYRGGRQADALAAYQRLRLVLADELGIDPSPGLRNLEAAILRQDPSLEAVPARWTRATQVPAQLPPAVPTFTGRHDEIAQLDALVDTRAAVAAVDAVPGPAAVDAVPGLATVAAVSGPAGVGKTAFAVHWAHRVAARFPHGQLYVDLRGFSPNGTALRPADAVAGILSALGVAADRIPATPDARINLYRSMLAGKRMLVLADNARDAEQVRPLIPGAAGCLVVVTSRDRLTGLVATHGAYPLGLLTPPHADARAMLTARIGAARAAAEPGAVDDIVAGCGRLPLAIAAAAARVAIDRTLPLRTLANLLHDGDGALRALHIDDPASDVQAALSSSYRTLGADAARLFRSLGQIPGPDVELSTAADLAGVRPPEAHHLLAELTGVHLLAECAPGRYRIDGLLRVYAAELARTHRGAEDGRATGRTRHHYRTLTTAHRTAAVATPERHPTAAPGGSAPSTLRVYDLLSRRATAGTLCVVTAPIGSRADLGRAATEFAPEGPVEAGHVAEPGVGGEVDDP